MQNQLGGGIKILLKPSSWQVSHEVEAEDHENDTYIVEGVISASTDQKVER